MIRIKSVFSILLGVFLIGCSNTTSNPINGELITNHDLSNPIFSESSNSQINTELFGAYVLNISPDYASVEISPLRSSSLGESYIVNGLNFFMKTPCANCLTIENYKLQSPSYLNIVFKIRHPFEPGNPNLPPSATNRLDLDVFDMTMVVVPKEKEPESYLLGEIYSSACVYQDGFTRDLDEVVGVSGACPYFLVVDDSFIGTSTNNRFSMGEKNLLFDVWFNDTGLFELYLTMGYGASAKKPQRLNPQYYLPEFNKKAAWKVNVIPPEGNDPPMIGNTWNDSDTTTEYYVTVEVYDWQIGAQVNPALINPSDIYAASDVEKVLLEIPGMTSTPIETILNVSGSGLPNDPLVFSIPVANANGLPPGTYTGLVKVLDERIPPYPYQTNETRDFMIDVGPNEAEDISPRWLNFSPKEICVQDNYAYVATVYNGLHIFDISDHTDPKWISRVMFEEECWDVTVSGNYAYAACGHAGLQIVDISTPQKPVKVKSVDSTLWSSRICVADGYAYVVSQRVLDIFDIDPVRSAYLVKSIESLYCDDVFVSGGYAYTCTPEYGTKIFTIFDISPPNSSHVIKEVPDIGGRSIFVSGDYAYIGRGSIVKILDINPPASTYLVKEIDLGKWDVNSIFVDGSYAYIANYLDGMKIIDIDPPDSATIVKTVDTPGWATGIFISDGYAYISDKGGGFHIVDVNPIDTSYIVGTAETPGDVANLQVSGDYAYVDNSAGFQIVRIDPQRSAHIEKTLGIMPSSSFVSGDYAYISSNPSYNNYSLYIVDINPPDSAYVVKEINPPYNAGSIQVSNGYAFAASYDSKFLIFDVDPPESAYFLKSIELPGVPYDNFVSGDYAYIANGYSGFTVININPPSSANIVKWLNGQTAGYCSNVFVLGNYAYVVDQFTGIKIFNVNPPNSTQLIKTIATQTRPYAVFVSDGYAYVIITGDPQTPWGGVTGIEIIDIDPISSPKSMRVIETPDTFSYGIYVSEGFLYVANRVGGLRIYKPFIPAGGMLNYQLLEYATYQTFPATVVDGP